MKGLESVKFTCTGIKASFDFFTSHPFNLAFLRHYTETPGTRGSDKEH
jgi:hypothetical protein